MRFQAVLFDLDGTLLDTIDDLADAMNSVLVSRGFPPHEPEAYRYFVGDGMENLVKRSIPAAVKEDAALVSACAKQMSEAYAVCWNVKTRPYPGINSLLSRLAELDVKTAILSNKPDSFVATMVHFYFKEMRFDAAFGERPPLPRKPDPAAALAISRLLQVEPQAFIYLGDTNTDMLTARAAGMYPVGALWGFRSETELRESGAARLIRDPGELLTLIAGAGG